MAMSGSFATSSYSNRNCVFNWNATNLGNRTARIDWSVTGGGSAEGYYQSGPVNAWAQGTQILNRTGRFQLWQGTVVGSGSFVISYGNDGGAYFTAAVNAAIYSSSINVSSGDVTQYLDSIAWIDPSNVGVSIRSTDRTSITINRSWSNATACNYNIGGQGWQAEGSTLNGIYCNGDSITGLQPNKAYTVQIRFINNNSNWVYSGTVTGTTTGNNPSINSVAKTPSRNGCSLVPTVSYDINASYKSVSIQYGTSTSYGNTSTSQTLTGLTPNTKYYYSMTVTDNWNRVSAASTGNFTTTGNIPVIASVTPTIERTRCEFYVATNYDENAIFKSVLIEYGTTTSYGNSSNSYSINGLVPNTTYYYRIRITDNWDRVSSYYTSNIKTIADAPIFSKEEISEVDIETAKLIFETTPDTNTLITSYVLYNSNDVIIENNSSGIFQLDTLETDTTYTFYCIVHDNAGNTTRSNDLTFTTLTSKFIHKIKEDGSASEHNIYSIGEPKNFIRHIKLENGGIVFLVDRDYATACSFSTSTTSMRSKLIPIKHTTIRKYEALFIQSEYDWKIQYYDENKLGVLQQTGVAGSTGMITYPDINGYYAIEINTRDLTSLKSETKLYACKTLDYDDCVNNTYKIKKRLLKTDMVQLSNKMRYIDVGQNGNYINSDSHIVELEVYDKDGINRARGIIPEIKNGEVDPSQIVRRNIKVGDNLDDVTFYTDFDANTVNDIPQDTGNIPFIKTTNYNSTNTGLFWTYAYSNVNKGVSCFSGSGSYNIYQSYEGSVSANVPELNLGSNRGIVTWIDETNPIYQTIKIDALVDNREYSTDGIKTTNNYMKMTGRNTLAQFDLGQEYEISSIKLWRYFGDNRYYKDTFVYGRNQDKELCYKFHDWKRDGEYPETSQGLIVEVNKEPLDDEAPVINSFTASTLTWTNNGVELTILATDNLGSENLIYSFDGGINWTNKNKTKVFNNKTYIAVVKDKHGNVSTTNPTIVLTNIDLIAPTDPYIELKYDNINGAIYGGEWTNRDICIDIKTTSSNNLLPGDLENGGIDKLTGELISSDNIIRSTYDGEFSKTITDFYIGRFGDITGLLTAYFYDENKNYLGYKEVSGNVQDNIVTAYPNSSYIRITDTSDNFHNYYMVTNEDEIIPYEPHYIVYDNLSGIKGWYYTTSMINPNFSEIIPGKTINQSKEIDWYIVTRDNAGNNSSPENIVVRIDKDAPVNPRFDYVRTDNSIVITASAVDDLSGIDYYQFSKDNGITWSTKQHSNVYEFNSLSGMYQFKIKVIDKAKNEAISLAQYIYIGNSKLIPKITSIDGNTNDWTNQNINLVINAEIGEDAPGGTTIDEYSFDGGATWQTSNTKEFSENQLISGLVKDSDGNISETYLIDIQKIDKILPHLNIPTEDTNISIGVDYDLTLGVSYYDNESGILDNSLVISPNSTLELPIGENIITYTIFDNAGNSISKTRIINVEGLVPSDDLYPRDDLYPEDLHYSNSKLERFTHRELGYKTYKQIKGGSL